MQFHDFVLYSGRMWAYTGITQHGILGWAVCYRKCNTFFLSSPITEKKKVVEEMTVNPTQEWDAASYIFVLKLLQSHHAHLPGSLVCFMIIEPRHIMSLYITGQIHSLSLTRSCHCISLDRCIHLAWLDHVTAYHWTDAFT